MLRDSLMSVGRLIHYRPKTKSFQSKFDTCEYRSQAEAALYHQMILSLIWEEAGERLICMHRLPRRLQRCQKSHLCECAVAQVAATVHRGSDLTMKAYHVHIKSSLGALGRTSRTTGISRSGEQCDIKECSAYQTSTGKSATGNLMRSRSS